MAPMYYREAVGAIVCYDSTNEKSFEMMQGWVEELQRNCQPGSINIAIASTKIDLEDKIAVESTRGASYAASIGAFYGETSAKNNTGVQDVFTTLAQRIYDSAEERARRASSLRREENLRLRRSEELGMSGSLRVDGQRSQSQSTSMDSCCY